MKNKSVIITIFFICMAVSLTAQHTFSVYNLTCEHEENPLGIETVNPRFSWQVNASERSFEQSAWQVLVADSEEALKTDQGNRWDSGKRSSSSSLLNDFGGKTLESGRRYYWKVRIWDKDGHVSRWSRTAYFQMGLLGKSDWSKAQWIALEKDKKDELYTTGIARMDEVLGDKKVGMYLQPQFRKEFSIEKEIKRATVYVSGLGHFDMYLNGDKVGDHFLDPGWTKYDKLALYVSFDVTEMLQPGQNVMGVMLGNGFYNTPRERYLKMVTSYGAPKMILKMQIEYTDGEIRHIITDPDWRVTQSPITFSSIYGGEDYDAGREQDGWMESGFDDRSWNKPVTADPDIELVSQRITPLTVRDRIPTVRLLQTTEGDWVYDLGQNFSGIPELKIKGGEKRPVKLYPAELLNPDQSINQSASGDPYYCTYTAKGNGIETWHPQFTYYGFRYVQVEGAVPAGKPNPDGLPEIIEITGLHTCNSAEEVGTFHCSNDMFNDIYSLIDWAMRSNMMSVLTDCPHREKLGWLEEAHLMQHSYQYRYDMARLYEKILRDMRSTQAANGLVPDIAPELVEFEGGFKDTPEWGSAIIICPWYVYQWYGDKRLMETYYPDMQRYLDYLTSRATGHIVSHGLGDWFDIGPKHPGEAQLTSKGVTATAIYYYNATLMRNMASLLGKTGDAETYEKLAGSIKKAFNDTFWNKETKKYDRDSQTANAMALYLGLTNDDNHAQAFENLVADIRGRNNALTAGDVGYRYVLRTLEGHGASGIIYDMNCTYDVPGYGWQLAHGATALTESWQAYGFVSNNHCMLGHLMEWLFGGLGGVRQADHSVGFKEIVFKPEVVGDIRHANVSFESSYGMIKSEWQDHEDAFTLRVEVPANSVASVYLPASDISEITESGVAVAEADGVSSVFPGKDRVVVTIGSGVYNFSVTK